LSIPYMPLYCGDYEADTAHLTIEEDGAYMRLLRLCWRSPGCCVPNDPAWIMRKMRVDAETYERTVAPIISEFFKIEKAKVYSPRLSAEHARISDTFEKRSAAGKKGGRPAKSLKSAPAAESPAKAYRKPTESNQNQNQNQNQKEEREVRDAPTALAPTGPRLEDFVSNEAARDYRAHRVALKAKLTPGAEKGICRELTKICAMGLDPTEALETAAARGWRAVKADWIINDKSKDAGHGQQPRGPQARAEIASDKANDFWSNYDAQADGDPFRSGDFGGAERGPDDPWRDSGDSEGILEGVVLRPAFVRR
jgi:uncharacterized protein YdaU (DUF1376 family)